MAEQTAWPSCRYKGRAKALAELHILELKWRRSLRGGQNDCAGNIDCAGSSASTEHNCSECLRGTKRLRGAKGRTGIKGCAGNLYAAELSSARQKCSVVGMGAQGPSEHFSCAAEHAFCSAERVWP